MVSCSVELCPATVNATRKLSSLLAISPSLSLSVAYSEFPARE